MNEHAEITEHEAPPVGVMPRWRWLELHGHHHDEYRYGELMAAIERYEKAGLRVPIGWRCEAEDIFAMYS